MANPISLYLLTGPTAVGKTELALAWAEKYQAEIVSCDSLLFYRGMNIGTAKPTGAELARVPHHLVDVCAVGQSMNIATYGQLARTAVDEITARGRRVLVTGGSGFYLKAFLGPVTDTVTVTPELRQELETLLASRGLEPLLDQLEALNPGGLGDLDQANPRRVIRALERCRSSGKTLATLQAEFAALPGPFADFAVQVVRLGRSTEELHDRISQRVETMLQAGLVEEVRALEPQGLRLNPSAARSIGYRETLAMLDGELPPGDLGATIAKNTRALVRKQRTWFRTQLPAHRVVPAGNARVEGLFEVQSDPAP
jgi:tRNA dimethylallyltransferase